MLASDARPSLSKKIVQELYEATPGGVSLEVSLATRSRWRIGGTAKAVVEPSTSAQVAGVMQVMRAHDVPFCIIGDASNVLFDDAGFDGVLLVIGRRMQEVRVSGDEVWAEAGVAVPDLAWHVARAGLSGIEHTVGIPGTLGGLVLMNGGSQRKGIGSSIMSVSCANSDGDLFELSQEECEFAYRSSRLQTLGAAVVGARLRLIPKGQAEIEAEMTEILSSRARRFPMDVPSCGSTFLSDPAMYETVGPPGQAIEVVGLKGFRRGGAQISERHANFFVNLGTASCDDILWLIALARNTVQAATGFEMDCEVRHVAPNGAIQPAHITALERWGADLTLDSAEA